MDFQIFIVMTTALLFIRIRLIHMCKASKKWFKIIRIISAAMENNAFISVMPVTQSNLDTFKIEIFKKASLCGVPATWGPQGLERTPLPAQVDSFDWQTGSTYSLFLELNPALVSCFLSTEHSKGHTFFLKKECESAIEQGGEWPLMWLCTASACLLSLGGPLSDAVSESWEVHIFCFKQVFSGWCCAA